MLVEFSNKILVNLNQNDKHAYNLINYLQNNINNNNCKKLLNDDNTINHIHNLLNNIFNDENKELSRTILMAFYIKYFSNELFSNYTTSNDEKLLSMANKMTIFINNIGKNITSEEYSEFLSYIDIFNNPFSNSMGRCCKLHMQMQPKINYLFSFTFFSSFSCGRFLTTSKGITLFSSSIFAISIGL